VFADHVRAHTVHRRHPVRVHRYVSVCLPAMCRLLYSNQPDRIFGSAEWLVLTFSLILVTASGVGSSFILQRNPEHS
jgi:hypothetical protein